MTNEIPVVDDKIITDFLERSPSTFYIDDGDETYFRYWNDDDLKIRTCHECKTSEFKSSNDGVWIIYLTKERLLWVCEQLKKNNYDIACTLCRKFCDRWRKKRERLEKI